MKQELAVTSTVLALPGKISQTGLQLPNKLTHEEYNTYCDQLERVEGAVNWWWGDLLNYNGGEWGSMYEEVQDKTGVKYQRLADAKWVASKVQFSVRTEKLSWNHHMLVAQFDQVNQKKWLAKAVKNNWTTRDLKHRLTLQKRLDRHQEIADEATTSSVEGPFPLIYADPPWEFSTYSWKGKEISPDKHYPTMDDDGIVNFMVNGRFVPELAHKDAALYIWCTSSNLVRALAVMEAWGFEYKTHAVWDKERTGTGYIFLNQHELLLYGTRGNIPAPMAIRSSVFQYPRGRHSAKPPEVREALDEMYPAFKKRNKIELFAREAVPDWTIDGYEAKDVA